MARLFLLSYLVLLICSACSYAQSPSDLDKRNGFKDFRFGDAKSKWASNLGAPNSRIANTYTYTGYCCQEAFGYALRRVSLSFSDQNKLSTIYLQFRDRESDNISTIFQIITSAFGKPAVAKQDSQTGNIEAQWHGKKVTLSCLATYKGAEEGGWEIALIFFDRATTDPSLDY